MMKYINYNDKKINRVKEQLVLIQNKFENEYKTEDIYSNSKIFEIVIANQFKHDLIKGHTGSRDAKSELGEYEYKHFKKSSTNHTWTFNDYSDATIKKLTKSKSVIFAFINDEDYTFDMLEWYYEVNSCDISKYLKEKTLKINNSRNMINISPKQLESNLHVKKLHVKDINKNGIYYKDLKKIFRYINYLEKITCSSGLLTSNKLFELFTAVKLKHNINSKQDTFDALDKNNRKYEYKVSQKESWTFQDITNNVLEKYLSFNSIILAIKDVSTLTITKIYSVDSKLTVELLNKKLSCKDISKRISATLSKKDLQNLKCELVYNSEKTLLDFINN